MMKAGGYMLPVLFLCPCTTTCTTVEETAWLTAFSWVQVPFPALNKNHGNKPVNG